MGEGTGEAEAHFVSLYSKVSLDLQSSVWLKNMFVFPIFMHFCRRFIGVINVIEIRNPNARSAGFSYY